MVVVHANGCINVHPKLVPTRDGLFLWVFSPLQHCPYVLAANEGRDALILAVMHIPDHLKDFTFPLSLMCIKTPEMGSDLSIHHRSVHLL